VAFAAWSWGIPPALHEAATARDRPAGRDFAARDWVLIAAFDNHTGEPVFDDVLEQALQLELVGSRVVNVVPRPRIDDALALMGRPADQRLDASLAREVALRDGGIRATLTGSIRRVGGTYALTTQVVDPVTARVVADITDDVQAPADLMPHVRAQAIRVRQALGEALPSIESSHATFQKVTTPSLAALQLYSKAAGLLDGDAWRFRPEAMNRYGSAEALLRKAVEIDPAFASAWLLLAHAISNQNRDRSEYVPFAERAMQLSASVGPVERYMIEGFTHRVRYDWKLPDRSDLQAAARAYEALLQFAPDHYWALVELLSIYRSLGRVEDVDRVTLHAAALRPHSARFAVDAAKIHAARRDFSSARTIVTRVLAQQPHEDRTVDAYDALGWARLWDAHEAWLNNDVKRALDAVRAAEQRWIDSSSLWHWQVNAIYAGLGRFDDANRVAKRIEPQEARERTLAYNALNRGRLEELRQMLRPDRRDFELLNRHLGMLTLAGWVSDAEWVFSERRRRRMTSSWDFRADFEGQLRAAQGRYAEAAAMMEPLKTIAGNRFFVDHALAVSRRGLGDLAGAIRELERVSRGRSRAVTQDTWQVHSWLRCRVRLAEFYREVGRAAEANDVFVEVRTLLTVADADHPLRSRLPLP
jgi:tetratricopeptide (TPR) repeat protein